LDELGSRVKKGNTFGPHLKKNKLCGRRKEGGKMEKKV